VDAKKTHEKRIIMHIKALFNIILCMCIPAGLISPETQKPYLYVHSTLILICVHRVHLFIQKVRNKQTLYNLKLLFKLYLKDYTFSPSLLVAC